MKIGIIAASLLTIFSLSAGAQDIKPVKDKNSKLYGYQNKGKVWVIEPQFTKAGKFSDRVAIVEGTNGLCGMIAEDGTLILPTEYSDINVVSKAGLCEIKQKVGRLKLYGVADLDGNIVLPVMYQNVNISKNNPVICAQTEAVWGVWSRSGELLFEPQFYTSPSFSNGQAVATDAISRLKGIICADGSTRLPINNFGITSKSYGYLALRTDFAWIELHDKGQDLVTYLNGYIEPYNTLDDNVKALTYKKLLLGERLHMNNLKAADVDVANGTRDARCADLAIDWGRTYNRFVRLELVPGTANRNYDMFYEGNNKYYTVRAVLCEANGKQVSVLSNSGCIEAVCNEGIVYKTELGERWIAFFDPNTPYMRSSRARLTSMRVSDLSSLRTALNLTYAEVSALADPTECSKLQTAVLKTENAGICARQQPPLYEPEMTRLLKRVEWMTLFNHHFLIDDVFFAKTKKDKPNLIACEPLTYIHSIDDFDQVSFKIEADVPIFWGGMNERYLRVDPIMIPHDHHKDAKDPKSCKWFFNDVDDSPFAISLALNLYEADGTFVTNIGETRMIGYSDDEFIYFEELGIALRLRVRGGLLTPEVMHEFIPEAKSTEKSISALEKVGSPVRPAQQNGQPGAPGTQGQPQNSNGLPARK